MKLFSFILGLLEAILPVIRAHQSPSDVQE